MLPCCCCCHSQGGDEVLQIVKDIKQSFTDDEGNHKRVKELVLKAFYDDEGLCSFE